MKLFFQAIMHLLVFFKHQDFTQEQHKRAKEVLAFLELETLSHRRVATLSTGQLRKSNHWSSIGA